MQNKEKIIDGRSMVEMLGVLAIIGVLSIGGVMGFRRAMDTHHVNNLMHDVSLLGMTVATRDQNAYNVDCHQYEEESFSIPVEFATCTATYEQDDLVVLTVTYNDNMPERIIRMIENRCTQGIYVSAGAAQFTVGPHGWDCELAAMESAQGPEDAPRWECATADDCADGSECINHKCRYCPDLYEVGAEGLSEVCCKVYATYYEFSYPVTYTNGKCVWKENQMSDEEKCASHQSSYASCYCLSSNIVVDQNRDPYCCDEGESKSDCCAAIGQSWCEKIGTCVSNASECESTCASHTIIDLANPPECSCSLSEDILDPVTHEPVKTVCCDTLKDYDSDCCDAAGGYWTGLPGYSGECYIQKPQENGTCIDVLGHEDFAGIVYG